MHAAVACTLPSQCVLSPFRYSMMDVLSALFSSRKDMSLSGTTLSGS